MILNIFPNEYEIEFSASGNDDDDDADADDDDDDDDDDVLRSIFNIISSIYWPVH